MSRSTERFLLFLLVAVVAVSGLAGIFAPPSHPHLEGSDPYFFAVALLSVGMLGVWKPLTAAWLSGVAFPLAWGVYTLNGYREPSGFALVLDGRGDTALALLSGGVVVLALVQLLLLMMGRASLSGRRE